MKRSYKLRKEYTKLAFEVYNNAKICVKCFRYDCRIEIHHRDLDITNNLEDNLQILCVKCHSRHHHKWKKLTEEHKKIISEKQKWNTNWLWLHHSEESKNKISIWNKWKKRTKEERIKMSIYRKWKKHSKETKEKLSKIRKEEYRTWKRTPNKIMLWKFWKDNHLSKKVNQYTKDWKFIKTWVGISVVERELWINHWNLCQCCLWKYKTAWWFKWEYFNN